MIMLKFPKPKGNKSSFLMTQWQTKRELIEINKLYRITFINRKEEIIFLLRPRISDKISIGELYELTKRLQKGLNEAAGQKEEETEIQITI